MSSRDLVGILEAAYAVSLDDQAWLEGLGQASRPILDAGLGVNAVTYVVSEAGKFQIECMAILGGSNALTSAMAAANAEQGPDFIKKAYGGAPCSTGREVFGPQNFGWQILALHGVQDAICLNGLDPSGHGCLIQCWLPQAATLSGPQRATLSRIASHISVAHRLRRALRSETAPTEAVLTPQGRLEHATDAAQSSSAQAQLKDAVRAIERARGPARHKEPGGAVAGWKGLVAARWSLVDQFERDGQRFIIARENEPRAPGPAALTARERDVIGYAALGHHNKLIAYELGIAHSTVRVLIARAAAKLGVRTRDELIRVAAELAPPKS